MEEMAHFAPSEPFPEIRSNFGAFEMTVAALEKGAIRLKDLAATMPPYSRAADTGACPVPLTVRGTQALVSFAPLAFKLFYAARQNAVLRRSPFPSP